MLSPHVVLLAGWLSLAQPLARPGDEEAVKAAFLSSRAADLLAYFHTRTALVADPARLTGLVKQLGDPLPARRDEACAELVCLGPAAMLPLRHVVNNALDREAASRARQCLQAIEGVSGTNLTLSAVRLLGAQRPAGTTETLLQFLPTAEDEQVVQQIQSVLIALDLADGKPDDALRKALQDPVPIRRAVAATVLARVGGSNCFAAIRALLKDPKPSVRLRAALALIDNEDTVAVPVLIDLLAELPSRQRKEAEDYLATLAGEWTITTPGGDDLLARQLKRDQWARWWDTLTGEALLKEFRARLLPDTDYARALTLINQLDQESVDEREKACAALIALGPRVIPLVRQVLPSGKPHLTAYGGKVLKALEKESLPTLPGAASRLLALRLGEGALPTLLAYLPFAPAPEQAMQMQELIVRLGWKEGQPAAILGQTLRDPVGDRRAAAALALLRRGPRTEDNQPAPPPRPEHRAAVARLLDDSDRRVRFTVGLALAELGERSAVPVLIALLTDLPLDQAGEVEEWLANLAGDNAPTVGLSDDPAQRKRCRDAWNQWWTAQGSRVDLARAGTVSPTLGRLLIVESYNATRRSGTVAELELNGKVRWQINNLQYPMDVQALPNGRLLIPEQGANRVSERDQNGKILWERHVPSAFYARRLRNGHTLLAGRFQVMEIDAQGKEVFTYNRPNETLLAVQRLRDGQTAFVTYQGAYVRLDARGKEAKSFHVPFPLNLGVQGADVLPGDRMLMTVFQLGKLMEYDAQGKVVWEAAVPNPGTPTRLRNGHTLLPANGASRLVQLDRDGKIVSEWKDLAFRPARAYRR
jgi:HEAT repeat protein